MPGVDGGAGGLDGHGAGTVGALQRGQVDVVSRIVGHQLVDLPPGRHTHVALGALGKVLFVILAENLDINEPVGIPVMVVGDGLAVAVADAVKDHFLILGQAQIRAYVRPVGQAEGGVEDVLAPAPLVKAEAHGDGIAGSRAINLGGHVVVLESLEGGLQLLHGFRDGQSQVIQPLLVDHGELLDGMDGVVIGSAGGGGAHHLGGGQAVDAAVVLGDGRLDIGVLLQDGGQVGHDLGIGNIGGQVDECTAPAIAAQVVVGPAHSLHGVGQVIAARLEADVDLLAQRVAHSLPGNLDAGVLHHGVEYRIVVIAAGQGGDAGNHIELSLLSAGVGFAGVGGRAAAFAAGGQRGQQHDGCQNKGQYFLHDDSPFHFISSLSTTLFRSASTC